MASRSSTYLKLSAARSSMLANAAREALISSWSSP
eukprot:CAMPEP_0179201748 /NCGR_PEP_ID=MMETSP0796-20121207/100417_1 /TAXON_ID=73915 /ORGANISM="Pyrodinium bahamense, Strain pbaha01" /LENGTH=34 /DNA_ID= /DNA_START= /DNA_END= /DNA_ORIENTATION=